MHIFVDLALDGETRQIAILKKVVEGHGKPFRLPY